ncbi:MAG TPA: alpha-amylase family glycosyl hydrolase [Vicinamibacterales bacterium]|nr:alpha-amylase family glycosyl hydrolase [Vicinamibacterales bacterium]
MRRHPHLYEINTWPWLDALSRREQRLVTLGDVPPAEWDTLAARGFDVVFLMGVWRRSPLGRSIALDDTGLRAAYGRALPDWSLADVVGSPYCVQAYEPDGRMGGRDGLARVREDLHARGIQLILDFVPNHTAFDHEWIASRPELYVQITGDDARRDPSCCRAVGSGASGPCIACARDPFFAPWRDVAQLNYFNPATREAMMSALAAVATMCDGIRCDMAMLVVNDVFARTWSARLGDRWPQPSGEFWPEAFGRVPGLITLAEVYWDRERDLEAQGFGFTYDKRLLDAIEHGNAGDIVGHLRAAPQLGARSARFLENHDEPRSAAVFGDRLPAAATLVSTLPGLRFFYDGQLDGLRVQTPVQLGRTMEEAPSPAVQALYDRLLSAAKSPVFHEGTCTLLDVDGAAGSPILAYAWRAGGTYAVVAVNVGENQADAHVRVDGAVPDGDPLAFADALSERTFCWHRADLDARGLYVQLPAGGAHLFHVTPQAALPA